MCKVKMGSRVKFSQNGKLFERVCARLTEHNAKQIVSPDSPVGQAMLGKSAGDKFQVRTPGGSASIEILEVT